MLLILHNLWLPSSLYASSEISSVAHHSPHMNVFVVYLIMQDLFVGKIHFFQFLSMSDKPWLHQLQIITAARGTSFTKSFHQYKEGEIPCAKNNDEASVTYQIHHYFLLHCFTCILRVNQGISKLITPSTSKSTNRVRRLIHFVGNEHLSILVDRVLYLKNLSVSKITGQHFSGWV